MLCNTGFHRLLASCRIGLLLLGVPVAAPAFSEEPSTLQVVPAKPFPNLIYKDANGKGRLLSQDIGKLTIVHFWATWCEACVGEYPQLSDIRKRFADRGLKVVTITMDGLKNTKNVREFYEKYHVGDLPPYFDTGTNAFRQAKTRGLPTSFFIDANGMKIAISEGPLNWQSKDALGFIEFHLRAAQ